MLEQHIEGQINSYARDKADGSHAKDIANKDDSKKTAVGKAATENLAARKQGLEKPDVEKPTVIEIKSSDIFSDPPKEDVEEQENAIEVKKFIIAGTNTAAEEKVAAVIEAAP